MDKVYKKDRSSAFKKYYDEISESLNKMELNKNLTPLKVGDYVVLDDNYSFQKDKAKILDKFKVINIRPHKNRRGGIGYKIHNIKLNYSYYVSRNAIKKSNER
ncbi:hypothetical protein [Christiangramia sp.]|uniref:hypothetical protein n=1 Tax=Christiangramia sp. TaxID=1931228 RepID=UPI0026315B0D|nr:hypothetical protein [Christiangramia sp.]